MIRGENVSAQPAFYLLLRLDRFTARFLTTRFFDPGTLAMVITRIACDASMMFITRRLRILRCAGVIALSVLTLTSCPPPAMSALL